MFIFKGTTQVGKGMINTVKQGMQSMNGGNLAFAGGSMSSGVGAVVTRASTEIVSQTGALSSAIAQVSTQISMAAAHGNNDYSEKESKKDSGANYDLKNVNSLEDANIKNVETYLDDALKDFTKAPLKKGDGVRYFDGKGNSWQLNYGYKNATDAIHGAPYLKTTINGKIIRVPLTK